MSILIQYIEPNLMYYPLSFDSLSKYEISCRIRCRIRLKVVVKLSDKEMEKWARKRYMDKKGFIRE